MSDSPSSCDPINPESSPVPAPANSSPSPAQLQQHPALFGSSLDRAPDHFRKQAAALRENLARVVLGESAPQAPEGPKEKKARLEKQVQEAQQELQELKVNEVRKEILELMAPLDLPALQVLKRKLIMTDWLWK